MLGINNLNINSTLSSLKAPSKPGDNKPLQPSSIGENPTLEDIQGLKEGVMKLSEDGKKDDVKDKNTEDTLKSLEQKLSELYENKKDEKSKEDAGKSGEAGSGSQVGGKSPSGDGLGELDGAANNVLQMCGVNPEQIEQKVQQLHSAYGDRISLTLNQGQVDKMIQPDLHGGQAEDAGGIGKLGGGTGNGKEGIQPRLTDTMDNLQRGLAQLRKTHEVAEQQAGKDGKEIPPKSLLKVRLAEQIATNVLINGEGGVKGSIPGMAGGGGAPGQMSPGMSGVKTPVG